MLTFDRLTTLIRGVLGMTWSESAVLVWDFENGHPFLRCSGVSLTDNEKRQVEEYFRVSHDVWHRQDGQVIQIDIRTVPRICGQWKLRVTKHRDDGRLRVLELRQQREVSGQPKLTGLTVCSDRLEAAGSISRSADRNAGESEPQACVGSVGPSAGWVGSYFQACEQLAAGLPEEPRSLLQARLGRLRKLSEEAPREFLLLALGGQLQGMPADSELAATAEGAALEGDLGRAALAIVGWQLAQQRGLAARVS